LWRIAMKPGKPFAWGRVADAHWFGLPGNPASAFTTWWLLARPALRKLVGMRNVLGRSIMAPLAEPVANRGDRRHFMRARLNENGEVSVAGIQASHIQSGLAEANALIDLPPESGYPAGAMVRVELMD
jgi:molybdopterin molybdotransferase